MNRQILLKKYFSMIAQEGLYSSAGNLRFHLKNLFEDITFENTRVLDIGGGSGIFSFYAACMGAKQVVCLEPEDEGSLPQITENFYKFQTVLSLGQVNLERAVIQSFEPENVKFDLILLHNAVNHLDEKACVQLLEDGSSREVYGSIFSKISSIAGTGSSLLISDCSKYNFFPKFMMKNPLAPHIDWYKHQAPDVWIRMLREAGFSNPRLKWLSLDQFRSLGQLLFGNRVASYFIGSYFSLKMEKSSDGNGNNTPVIKGG